MPYSSADPNAFLGLGMQSALGTPQVTPAKLRFAKYLSGNSFEVQPEVVDLREGGDGLDVGYNYKKSLKAAGQLVVNARPEIAGQLLQLAMGGATWDGASLPALHTFSSGHASYPWFTILAQHPGSAIPHLISDAKFIGFTLDAVSGEPWKLTLPFIAINPGASFAAVTPTYYRDEPFVFHYNPTYVIDGSADSDITGFKLDQGLGVEELQSQAITLDEIVVQNRDLSLEITRRFESPALWQKVNYQGGVAPTQSVATGVFRAGVGYAGGGSLSQIDIFANLLSYRSLGLTELDPDGKTVMETISARILKGATHALVANLRNQHASAYA